MAEIHDIDPKFLPTSYINQILMGFCYSGKSKIHSIIQHLLKFADSQSKKVTSFNKYSIFYCEKIMRFNQGEALAFWINICECQLHPKHTAIPYRESTGFLQGIPCVVFPPLHALAVYRV